MVLAGTSIGSGEWLFGPAVTAQYGASLLWLALLSILLQGFCNLVMMRYAVYSGEPIIVGGLRTWPGPACWIGLYAILDVAAIWPYNASNAAVPLAAVILGHLPQTASDQGLVKAPRLRDLRPVVRPLDLRRHGVPDAREDHDGEAGAGAGLPVDHRA